MLEEQEKIRERENHRVFKQLLNTFIEQEDVQMQEPLEFAQNIKIIPKIYYDDFNKRMKVEFKIGDKQFYKIKNLPDFYAKMLHGEPYQYGSKLNLVHKKDSFSEESLPILEFILKYAEIMKYNNEIADSYTYYKKAYALDNIFISNMGLDDLFNALQNTQVELQRNAVQKTIYFANNEPEIPFRVKQLDNNKFEFKVDFDIFSYEILEGKDYTYMLLADEIYRLSEDFKQNTLKVLDVLRKNYTNQIYIDESELNSFFAIIAPNIKSKILKENLLPEVEERCIPKQLATKIYLDYDKNNYITADIRFCYENTEFNPLINEKLTIARNIIKENEVLSKFIKTGFMLDRANTRLILANEDSIYKFLSEEIEDYMKNYEVLATESFKQKEIHNFKIENLGIRLENNLLEIDLSQIGIDLTDLSQMLQKYELKKKFHRLKDGSYIKLEESQEMAFLDELATNVELEQKELESGKIKLPAYRTLYLDRMLKSLKNVDIKKDITYQNMIDKLENNNENVEINIPNGLNADLRNYQKLGYSWLKTLDEYHFGGILADDMGLRKNCSSFSCYIGVYK